MAPPERLPAAAAMQCDVCGAVLASGTRACGRGHSSTTDVSKVDPALLWLPAGAADEGSAVLATRRAVGRPWPEAPRAPHVSRRQRRLRAEELLAARFAAARAAPTPPQGAVHLEVSLSLHRGRPTEEGPEARPYRWDDLLEADAPRLPRPGAVGGYVLGHDVETDPQVRLTYATLVHARGDVAPTGGRTLALHVAVDARVTVEERALLEVVRSLRRAAFRREQRRRDRLARRIARHRYAVRQWPAVLVGLAYLVIGFERKVGGAFIGSTTACVRAFLEFPDVLVNQLLRADHHVGHRLRRGDLWTGLKDPRSLTTEQRGLLLFLTAVAVAAAVLVLNTHFALVDSRGAEAYRLTLFNAGMEVVSQFGVPFFVEPVLLLSIPVLGPVLAVAGFAVGKLLGVWVLYLLGASLHGQLARWTAEKPRAQRVVAWMTRCGDRWGFLILFLDNALPLMPDQVQIVFAVSGVRFRTWMVAIMGGTMVKFTLVVAAYYIVGPEPVAEFFTNPLGWW